MNASRSEPLEPQASRPQAPEGYPFSRGTAELLSWSYAQTRLRDARNYWLATCRPDGRPHVTPVWGVWIDEFLYFDGHPHTRWARNIAANPAVSLHLESGEEVLIVDGTVDDVTTDAATGARIVQAWDTKYGRLHPEPAGRGMFRLRPASARAWSSSSLEDGTRWQWLPPPAPADRRRGRH